VIAGHARFGKQWARTAASGERRACSTATTTTWQ